MATIAEVARAAKVSVSTVSYTLSGRRPISEETRRRVLTAMDELGYRPHALARGLASKRSRILALLFPMPERGLGYTELEFVTGAVDTAMARGYQMILWPAVMQESDALRNLIQQSLVDGVVVMEVHQQDDRITALREMAIPFTIIGRCADNTGLDYVDVDFETTVDEAVAYLAGLGHRSIAFISHSQAELASGYGPTVRCSEAFDHAIVKHGVRSIRHLCNSSAPAGIDAVRVLREALPDVTAILVMNDRALTGVLQGLDDWGRSVPADVSLISLISSPKVGEMFRPALTTYAPPSTELARLGVELLIDKLEKVHHRNRQVLISCQLVDRGSSVRPQRLDDPELPGT